MRTKGILAEGTAKQMLIKKQSSMWLECKVLKVI